LTAFVEFAVFAASAGAPDIAQETRMNRRPTPIAAPRMPAAPRLALALLGGLLLAFGAAQLARAATVSALRVMLHPAVAAPGELPAAAQQKLETLAGSGVTLAGTTRTGALDLTLAVPRDESEIPALLQRLRGDRAVLWVEASAPGGTRSQAATVDLAPASTDRGQKLLVRLKTGVAEDWDALGTQFSALLGVPVTAERKLGNVWVVSLLQSQPADRLAQLAGVLQSAPEVQFADPVLRRRALAAPVPNDPLFGRQWGLTDPISGINAQAAWNVQTGSAGIIVAVVDTGILPHPDLTGRALAGYDFISDAGHARDGDARDPNPRDEGDWIDAGGCGGYPAQDSFFHGLFIAGQIAANANNGIGVAGLDWKARILPVRTLGECGGTDEDIAAGMMWAAGVPIAGIPANANPARVINLSLGGPGECPQTFQEAIDDAMAQGSVVVVAAGNSGDNASGTAPANCSGVITVGAINRAGDRTFYSNYGRRIDLMAPAGDGGSASDAIVSTHNDGTTVPANPDYTYGIGTSFAAPYVSGTVSLMLARNPTLTPGRVLGILQGTARTFPPSSSCSVSGLCGAGMLDAGLAVASTVPSSGVAPPGTAPVIEYYSAQQDHYFITADPAEIAYADTVLAGAYERTGFVFYAYVDPAAAPVPVSGVCRFYAAPSTLIDSHFYTADPNECNFIYNTASATWQLETIAAFYVQFPDAAGTCPSGTLPIYRFFNNRRDANQRHTADLSVRRAMINRSWVPDGVGPTKVAFCTPAF
jgi:serine protease